MELYQISQSRRGVSQAYLQLMNKISAHVTLLAEHGKPITSLMGVKRGLFRFKTPLCPPVHTDFPSVKGGNGGKHPPLVPPEGGMAGSAQITGGLALLIGDVLDKLGLDVLEAVEVGLVGERDLKRVLIKYDYGQLVKQGLKHKDIKQQLGEKYGWSVSSIEKLVYRKTPPSMRKALTPPPRGGKASTEMGTSLNGGHTTAQQSLLNDDVSERE